MALEKIQQRRIMKFCIVLRNRFTGEETHLGSSYETAELAKVYAEGNLCKACNLIEIRPVHESFVYAGRRDGFVSIDMMQRA